MASQTEPLTSQDVNRFLRLKGIDHHCPACRGGSVGYQDETGGNTRFSDMMFPFPGWNIMDAGTMDKVVLSCNDCGYIRSFNRDTVLSVLAK